MAEFLVLMGGNTGDLPEIFARAERMIATRIGLVAAQSRDHWTEPWGFTDERLFLNRAVIVETNEQPEPVMKELLAIEHDLGRARAPGERYGPRPIDLDILFIGDEVIEEPGLTVPHPRVQERAFALAPAADLVPALVHPIVGRTVLELLNDVLKAE